MLHFEVESVNKYIKILEKLFEQVRIVNPKQNYFIYESNGELLSVHRDSCYKFWEKGQVCENCISVQALKGEDALTKIEYKGDKIYLVMVQPVIIDDCVYILELLKNVSETGLILELSKSNEMFSLINKLNEKVLYDELTNVYNRRYINQNLSRDIVNAESINERFMLAMIDIDSFKRVNDNYGHIAGDKALKELAQIFKSRLGNENGWVARYGGDEFLIFVRDLDNMSGYKILDEIRKAIEEIELKYNESIIKITISAGAYIVESNVYNFEEVIKMADENLKEVKKLGGNKVLVTGDKISKSSMFNK